MAKLKKKFKTIRKVTAKYHPLALRRLLLNAHYRSPLTYSKSQLESLSDSLYYIYQTLQDLVEALSPYQETLEDDNGKAEQTKNSKVVIKKMKTEFQTKMSNDLNTSPVLTGAFQEAMKFINVSINKLEKTEEQQMSLLEVEKGIILTMESVVPVILHTKNQT